MPRGPSAGVFFFALFSSLSLFSLKNSSDEEERGGKAPSCVIPK
jgi:hypothetical protein